MEAQAGSPKLHGQAWIRRPPRGSQTATCSWRPRSSSRRTPSLPTRSARDGASDFQSRRPLESSSASTPPDSVRMHPMAPARSVSPPGKYAGTASFVATAGWPALAATMQRTAMGWWRSPGMLPVIGRWDPLSRVFRGRSGCPQRDAKQEPRWAERPFTAPARCAWSRPLRASRAARGRRPAEPRGRTRRGRPSAARAGPRPPRPRTAPPRGGRSRRESRA